LHFLLGYTHDIFKIGADHYRVEGNYDLLSPKEAMKSGIVKLYLGLGLSWMMKADGRRDIDVYIKGGFSGLWTLR